MNIENLVNEIFNLHIEKIREKFGQLGNYSQLCIRFQQNMKFWRGSSAG